MPCWVYMYRSLPVLSGWSVTSCWGLYVPEAYLSCQGGLSCLVGFYMYRSLPVLSGWSVTSCWGLYGPEAYLSCQGGLSRLDGVYMYQKLTCPVRVVCHVLLGFICTRSLPVLSLWFVTSCWGLYVPEAYLSCQGGLSCLVRVYMYQKLTCPVRAVCNVLLGFICIRNLLALIH